MRLNVFNLHLDRLRDVIWEAWEAVTNSLIERLINSWWDRCRAAITGC